MIKVRALEEGDLNTIKYWRNDSVGMCREYRFLNYDDQKQWFQNYQRARHDSDWGQELMMINEEAVGGFVRIQWRNRRAELSYLRSEYSEYSAREDIHTLIEMGFDHFGFNKLTWPVYSHNPYLNIIKSIMTEEAILKEEYFHDGAFLDRHYMSITKKQFDKTQNV